MATRKTKKNKNRGSLGILSPAVWMAMARSKRNIAAVENPSGKDSSKSSKDSSKSKNKKPSWNERQKASTHVTGKSRTWRVDSDENRKLQQKAGKNQKNIKSTYNTPSTKKAPKPATKKAEWKPTAIQKKLMKSGWTKEELQAKAAKHAKWKADRKAGKLKIKKSDRRKSFRER